MPDDYYSDGDGGGSPSAPAPESGGDGEAPNDQTALVPKAVFGGKELKPGDKCDIEVVRVHEDAYEVQGCEGGAEHEYSQPPAEAPAPDGSMASMME